MKNDAMEIKWNLLQKILFRFFFVYFLFITAPYQILGKSYIDCFTWVGTHFLKMHRPQLTGPSGSGDTTFNFIGEFISVSIALICCLAWGIFDYKRLNYHALIYWLKVLIRYYLAIILILYGYSKIFQLQFLPPDIVRLSGTYGDSSPMGLAWTFLGYSTPFVYFMGFLEIMGGVLLFFRQTTLLGACIATAVLINVVMINFCFDVPVKLFSSHLLIAAIFLLACNCQRLLNFFIFNKAIGQADLGPIYKKSFWRYLRFTLKSLIIFGAIVGIGYKCFQRMNESKVYFASSPLNGNYDVETFVRNNDTLDLKVTSERRWRTVIIPRHETIFITTMDDSRKKYKVFIDTNEHSLSIADMNGDSVRSHFIYCKTDSTAIDLNGYWNFDKLFIRLRLKNKKDYLLMTRGFHWINEQPFNR